MRRALHRSLIAVLLIIATLTCAGCWGRRELDTLAIVSAVAIDLPPGGKEGVYMTVQVLNIPHMGSTKSGGGGETGKEYLNIATEGATVHEAIRKCTLKLSRRLLFPHNQVLIFSEEVARQGIEPYIDFFLRDVESRHTQWVIVTKKRAEEVLSTENTLEPTPSQDIFKLIEARSANSLVTGINLDEMIKRITSKCSAPLASYVETQRVKGKMSHYIHGTAVFDQNLKMVGILSPKETRGLLWAIGEIKSGIIVIKTPGGNAYTSMEILRASGSLKPDLKNGIRMKVEVNCESNVSDTMDYLDMMSPEVWQSLRNREAAVIKNEIRMALKKSRQLNVDIFGLGDMIYKKDPAVWRQIADEWPDVLNSMDVQINVKTKLERSGKIGRSVINK